MTHRRGEKIGWTAGWLGGFVWIAVLSVVFLFQGKALQGLVGLFLFGVAAAGVLCLSPWRHPSTSYWKLMVLPYGALYASGAWVIWAYGGIKAAGVDWWMLVWLLPLMIPAASMFHRKWSDFTAPPGGREV